MDHVLSIAVMDKIAEIVEQNITNMDKVTEIVDQNRPEWAMF